MSRTDASFPPEGRLRELVGEDCSLVEFLYGGELMLGFGTLRPAKPPLRDALEAEWALCVIDSPWVVEDSEGVVVSDSQRDKEASLSLLRDRFIGHQVEDYQLRSSRVGLTLAFESGVSFLIQPKSPTSPSSPCWELFTPKGDVLVAEAGLGLRTADAKAPFLGPLVAYVVEEAQRAQASGMSESEYLAGSPSLLLRTESRGASFSAAVDAAKRSSFWPWTEDEG
ncbi:MAG: hypothetical protein WD757_03170 [Actinomycetota bacterium]